METKNAIISNVTIDFEDRGILTSWIQLDYGGAGQSFGGLNLYLPKSFDHHTIKSYAGHFIFRVMEIAGVTNWDAMKGKTIRVKIENGLIVSIGHIIKDDWFTPSKDFKAD